MKAARLGSVLLVALMGCVGPLKADRSAIAIPEHYAADDATPPSLSSDGIAQSLAPGAPPAEWWREFRSPELDALVQEGVNHSPSLAAAQGTLRAAREQLRAQIGSNLYPSIDAGFAPSRQRALTIPGLREPTFLYSVFALEAQASYKFDFFGAAVNADRALARQVEQQRWQFEATRRALATNIVIASINTAALSDSLQATEQQADQAEDYARQIAAMQRLGRAGSGEALAAELSAAQAAAQVPPLRAQLLGLRHTQAILLGRTPDRAPPPLTLASLQVPGQIPLSVPSELLHQRPDILAAEAAMQAAAYEAGAAAALLYPSLTLTAAIGHAGFDWSDFKGPAGKVWSVGASLSQPLFHGGALRAQKRQYAALYSAAQSNYQQTVLAAFQNVADTLAALEQDNLELEQALRAETAAQALDENLHMRYRLGAVPWTAALSAAGQHQAARSSLARARAARLADTAALYQAMGMPPSRPGDGSPARE